MTCKWNALLTECWLLDFTLVLHSLTELSSRGENFAASIGVVILQKTSSDFLATLAFSAYSSRQSSFLLFHKYNNWNLVTCFCVNLSECVYLWGKCTRLLELGNRVKRIVGSSMYRSKADSFKIRRFIISKLYVVLL